MRAAPILLLPLFLALAACASSESGAPTQDAAATAPAAQAAAPAPEPAAAVPAEPAAVTPAAPAEPSRWGMLFVAGDHSITAFDNATRRFYNIVQGKPRVKLRRLTSDPAIAPSPEEIATLGTLDEGLTYINSSQAA